MFGLGPLELGIIAVLAIVLFGPKRLPKLGRQLGNGLKEFRGAIDSRLDKDGDEEQLPAAPEASSAHSSADDDAPVVDAEPVPENRSKSS